MREGTVGFHHDAFFAADLARVAVLQERRYLDLIDRRNGVGNGEKLFQMGSNEVAHTDRPRPLLFVKAFEGAPGVEPLAANRPVDEIKVDVIEAEARKAAVESAQGLVVALVFVPQLGGDEDFLPCDAARSDPVADVGLVAINSGGVDMSIAEAQSRCDGMAGRFPARRLPDAETHL